MQTGSTGAAPAIGSAEIRDTLPRVLASGVIVREPAKVEGHGIAAHAVDLPGLSTLKA